MFTVLLVDDDPITRYACRRILEAAGYNVRVAENGKEGLAMQTWFESDVVVTDIAMPGVDGIEMAAAMRARTPKTPVIVYTGVARASLAEALRVGACTVLTKPFSNESLLRAVEQAVSDRKIT